MLFYWFFGLLMVVPLAGIAALLSRVVRPYVSVRTLTLWGGLCVSNGLICWGMYQYDKAHCTVYATGYDEVRFQQIAVGMSEAQVRLLLGEPLVRWRPYEDGPEVDAKGHYVGYEYSRSKNEGDYELRQINFDRGRVAEVRCYYYYD